jgi:hypothetical protein
MLEKIYFTETDFVYRTNLGEYSKDSLINEIEINIDVDMGATKSTAESPGIQSYIVIKGGEMERVSNKVNKIILEEIYKELTFPFSFRNWIYLSESNNSFTGYHRHIEMQYLKSLGQWTWTFYAQMPDNLKGDDGKLFFMLDDSSVHGVLPNEGDVFIFPANMLHKPNLNSKSNKSRIVMGGIISKLDLNHRFNKKQKTLF